MVQWMEVGAFVEELLQLQHGVCIALSVVRAVYQKWSEMKASGNVKSIPVADPETGNISTLSQMEVADENLSFQVLTQMVNNLKGRLL